MSRKIKERNLKPVVTRSRAVKTKLADSKKKERIDRKGALRDRSLKTKTGATTRIAKSKKPSVSEAMTRAVDNCQLVKPKPVRKAVRKSNSSAKESFKLDEINTSLQAQPEEQNLLPEMDAPAGPEMNRELQPVVSQETLLEPEALLPDNAVEEKQVVALAEETEVPMDLAETRPSTGMQWETILRWWAGACSWVRNQLGSRHAKKRLRVCETVSLGEKRFVAVIEVDGEQFLVGGASSSVTTLARLEPAQEFSQVLKGRWAQDPV